MKNLESYLELPFEYILASREKICLFFETHYESLNYMVTAGAPFASLLTPTKEAVVSLRSCIGQTTTSIAQQKSTTYTTDECIDIFVKFVKTKEAKVRDKYGKDSALYIEFYPNGMKPFNNISKKSVDALLEQQIAAYKNHPNDFPPELLIELQKISDNYHEARQNQQSKKSQTKEKQQSWDECLEIMKDQAFVNLLTIAKEYRGKPDKIKLFFDTSIIAPPKPKENTESGYILDIPAASKKPADISFSVDDSLLINNNGNGILYCYAAATADAAEPANMIEIQPADQIEISALSLGAPANKFLIFVNKDTTQAAQAEIILL